MEQYILIGVIVFIVIIYGISSKTIESNVNKEDAKEGFYTWYQPGFTPCIFDSQNQLVCYNSKKRKYFFKDSPLFYSQFFKYSPLIQYYDYNVVLPKWKTDIFENRVLYT